MTRRCLLLAAGLGLTAGLSAATFTVTNANDSGSGSLRQAILDANTSAGADTILFNIPGSGVHTISPASQLPSITEAVVIDGYTQPGASANTLAIGDDATLLIEIAGTNIGGTGLLIEGPNGGSTLRGLVINRWGTSAIRIGSALASNGNIVEGNFIGTDPTGTATSGSAAWMTYIASGSSNNLLGGTSPASRNVIVGGGGVGGANVLIEVADNNFVQGNYLGINAAGTAALPGGMLDDLVISSAAGNTIGGTAAGAGNVIVAPRSAVVLKNANATPTTNNLIQGNLVGTDASGTAALGGQEGIVAGSVGAASSNTIGGAAAGAGNLISGTTTGILISDLATWIIQGNRIGTDITGTAAISNTSNGIQVQADGAAGSKIGGTNLGEGNTIAFNGGAGVSVIIPNTGWPIRGNSIFSNGGLGIDLSGDGPNFNDPGDADEGPNHLQNFPIVQTVTNGASTHVTGKLNSAPSTTFDLDFYANAACSNFPRELLEAEIYLGSSQVTTDGSGDAAIDVTLPAATEVGARITATATDPLGNTSEFSQRIIFSIGPTSGDSGGGASIGASGTDFADPTTMTIGGVATTVNFVNDHTLTTTSPTLSPGTVNDVVVTTPDGTTGTLYKGWVADFLDVPGGQQFYSFVTKLVSNGLTAGVGGGLYGVDASTLRQQMAVFLLKARHGLCYTPPPCTPGFFADVACPSTFANWIEALAGEGITGGCGGGNYCPTNPVRRDQMAVFLLKAEHGSAYVPPVCVPPGVFPDVPCPGTFTDWIEQLAAEAITGGCGGSNYCPGNPNTRGQMAVFITKTFNLQ